MFTNTGRLKCDECGRFFASSELDEGGGASWVFVPDSDVTAEEQGECCKACTEAGKRRLPHQSVRLDYCSGIA